MRRILLTILGGLFLTGCAAATQQTQPLPAVLQDVRDAKPAGGALAFDPALAQSQPMPMLWRDDRDIAAFGGFQTLTSEFYDIQTDDHQLYQNDQSTYERRVYSDRVGIIFR